MIISLNTDLTNFWSCSTTCTSTITRTTNIIICCINKKFCKTLTTFYCWISWINCTFLTCILCRTLCTITSVYIVSIFTNRAITTSSWTFKARALTWSTIRRIKIVPIQTIYTTSTCIITSKTRGWTLLTLLSRNYIISTNTGSTLSGITFLATS